MNYRLNFAAMLIVFSIVTYNVCMAFQDMEDVNIQSSFQKIGLLHTPESPLVPAHKPSPDENRMASIN